MAAENTNVRINDVEYLAVTLVDLALSADVQEETVEEGFPVTDEIKVKPAQFNLTLRLYKRFSNDGLSVVETRQDQFNRLNTLYKNKVVFRFESDFGVFDNSVIASFNPTVTAGSKNAYDVSLTVREIIFARLLPATFQFLQDADGNIIGVTPSDGQLVEVTLTTPEANPVGVDPSILEQLIAWFSGWWPWG